MKKKKAQFCHARGEVKILQPASRRKIFQRFLHTKIDRSNFMLYVQVENRILFFKTLQFAVMLLLSLGSASSDAIAQKRLTLWADQDAFVDGGEPRQNFGGDKELTVKKSKTGKRDRLSYLQFALPKISEPIRFAVLECKINGPAPTAIEVGVTVDNWRESGINWSNTPGKVTSVAEVPALGSGKLLVDVTKTLQQARKAKVKTMTFVLAAKDVTKSRFRIASRETDVLDEQPRLTLVTNKENDPLPTSIVYTSSEKGTFAGLKLGKTSGQESLGKFGGWKDWSMKATGFFRTQKLDDLWTMVDPQGYAFFGFGLNSVTEVSALRLPQEIKAIGFNHLGSWSDETIKDIPYTPRWNFVLEFKNSTAEIKRNFLDDDLLPVFEPTFERYVDRQAAKAAEHRNDPWILGHFTDNEIPFHKTIQLKKSLRLPRSNPQHKAAANWFKEKHGRKADTENITEEDELQYMGFVADQYYRIVTKALRKHDPNHLILGERVHASAKYNPHVIKAAGKYCDVISINFYRKWEPGRAELAMWRDVGKKPFIITEFYAKAADSGLDNKNGAGWVVPTQIERAQHFENFALQMLGTPHCVGIHWFRFVDDEGSNKGVYNSKFQPYRQLQDSMKNVSRQMYHLRSKQIFGDLDFNGQAIIKKPTR